MATTYCPFCGSAISPSQLAELREKIKKAQDPAILGELESLRESIRLEEKQRADLEIQALRSKLGEFQKRERELDERDADIKARAATVETEVRTQVTAREKVLREEISRELSQRQRAELEEKDQRIIQLERAMEQQKEHLDAEVNRLVADRENKVREDERARVEKAYEPLRGKIADYQQRESGLLERERSLELRQQELELSAERRVREGESKIRQEEKSRLEKTYEPLRLKIEEYQQREADFLRKEEVVSLRENELELRVAREVSQKRGEILEQARKQAQEKHGIELSEKERVIGDLRKQLEDAQRLIETGSPQRRGLIQQEEVGDTLARLYPEDEIIPISAGVRGADVLQNVRSSTIGVAGSIYWESKRTKDFHPSWLAKLREDQQAKKADIAALVSVALPEDVEGFKIIDGVLVLHPRLLEPVAGLIRQYLVNLARQRLTMEQREEKIHKLFGYMTGKEFFQRIATIVEAQAQLIQLNDKERKAHERIWANRDQFHLSIGRSVAQLYGDVEGIVGSLPPVRGLQLPTGQKELLDGREQERPKIVDDPGEASS